MKRIGFNCMCLLMVLCSISPILATVEYGIAGNYPFDEGLEKDPNVVFFEDFEKENLSDIIPPWSSHLYPQNISFTADKAPGAGGSGSVYFSSYATILRKFPGQDTVYMRYYAKYGSQCNIVHHGVWLGGTKALGYASTRPSGYDYFLTGIEPGAQGQWRWDFYTYWPGMGDCVNEPYWGVTFLRDNSIVAARGQWVCIEFMVKMNNPVTATNGEQAFWINGEKKAHFFPGSHTGGFTCNNWNTYSGGIPFPGFQWRKTSTLKTDHVILQHYVDTDLGCPVSFDNLVVSKKYIGPATGTGTPPADIGAPYLTGKNPKPDETWVLPNRNISLIIKDKPAGVDKASIVMKVKGQIVSPTITGTAAAYTLTYDPPVDFAPGETVQVEISAKDLWTKTHTMNESYRFIIKPGVTPFVQSRNAGVMNAQVLQVASRKGLVRFQFAHAAGEGWNLAVFDLAGRQVWKYSGKQSESVAEWSHGDALKKGAYMVRAEQNGKTANAIYCHVW